MKNAEQFWTIVYNSLQSSWIKNNEPTEKFAYARFEPKLKWFFQYLPLLELKKMNIWSLGNTLIILFDILEILSKIL